MKKMEKKIFELLEEWDLANVEGFNDEAKEIGRKIEALRVAYRMGENEEKDVKVVGRFLGKMCGIYINGNYIGTLWDLKYTEIGSSASDMRLYANDYASIWLDYAVYE